MDGVGNSWEARRARKRLLKEFEGFGFKGWNTGLGLGMSATAGIGAKSRTDRGVFPC